MTFQIEEPTRKGDRPQRRHSRSRSRRLRARQRLRSLRAYSRAKGGADV